MDNFELPTNVRQIGSIETSGLRIYVEDYVFTFVQQYTQAHSSSERLGILVGRYIETEPNPILFISGAIEGKFSAEGPNGIEFSKKTNDYVADILDKYFPGLKVVGWLQSQPGYGTYLSSKNYNYHKENYKEVFQVLFVTDPVQRLDAFYIYNEDGELCESNGYFVYYDKNKPMHEYMIDNRVQGQGSATIPVSVTAEKLNTNIKPQKAEEEEKEEEEDINSLPVSKRRIRELRESTEKPQVIERRRSAPIGMNNRSTVSAPPRRLVNMLASLSAVMFIVVFIMGAGLIRSDERINILEENLIALNTAYRNLSQTREADVPAFAQETSEPPEVRAEIDLVVTEDGNRLLTEENTRAAETAAANNETPGGAVASSSSGNAAETAFANLAPPVTQEPSVAVTPPATVPDTYTVQRGDNLLAISQRMYGTGTMVQQIMDANGIEDADKIFFGQVLVLPRP